MSLKIENLSVRFKENKVLENFNLDVSAGETIAILGASGIGKTTILRAIAGLVEIESGTIILNSRDITNLKIEDRRCPMLFQDLRLFPHLNVFENVRYSLLSRKRENKLKDSEIKEKTLEVLKRVSLEGLENRYVDELSGGQKQRVAFARALNSNPDAILLDEPFSQLDRELKEKIWDFFLEIKKDVNVPIIIVTHDIEEARLLSDRIVYLD